MREIRLTNLAPIGYTLSTHGKVCGDLTSSTIHPAYPSKMANPRRRGDAKLRVYPSDAMETGRQTAGLPKRQAGFYFLSK